MNELVVIRKREQSVLFLYAELSAHKREGGREREREREKRSRGPHWRRRRKKTTWARGVFPRLERVPVLHFPLVLARISSLFFLLFFFPLRFASSPFPLVRGINRLTRHELRTLRSSAARRRDAAAAVCQCDNPIAAAAAAMAPCRHRFRHASSSSVRRRRRSRRRVRVEEEAVPDPGEDDDRDCGDDALERRRPTTLAPTTRTRRIRRRRRPRPRRRHRRRQHPSRRLVRLRALPAAPPDPCGCLALALRAPSRACRRGRVRADAPRVREGPQGSQEGSHGAAIFFYYFFLLLFLFLFLFSVEE